MKNPLSIIIILTVAFFTYVIGSIIIDQFHIQELEKKRLRLTNEKLRLEILELKDRKE